MTPYGPAKFVHTRIAANQAYSDMVTFQRQKINGAYTSVAVYPPSAAQGKLIPCQ